MRIAHPRRPAGPAPSLSVRIARRSLAAAPHPHGQASLYELRQSRDRLAHERLYT